MWVHCDCHCFNCCHSEWVWIDTMMIVCFVVLCLSFSSFPTLCGLCMCTHTRTHSKPTTTRECSSEGIVIIAQNQRWQRRDIFLIIISVCVFLFFRFLSFQQQHQQRWLPGFFFSFNWHNYMTHLMSNCVAVWQNLSLPPISEFLLLLCFQIVSSCNEFN